MTPSPLPPGPPLLAHPGGHPDRALWFHGTRSTFTRFEHGHSLSLDWNAHLGVHVADRPEAAEYALNTMLIRGDARPARLLEVRVADLGALHVSSETELAAMALSLAHTQGIFNLGPPHTLSYADMSRAKVEAVRQSMAGHVKSVNFNKLGIAAGQNADAAYRPARGYPAQAVIAVHLAILPTRSYQTFVRKLADALRADLSSKGVRVITYPNDVEGGLSAVALDLNAILNKNGTASWEDN